MKRALLIPAFLLLYFIAPAQKIPAYTASTLMQRIHNNDTLYIVNFWATWCIPCVKELPAFDTLQNMYKGKPVKVLLVSFDFKESYPAKMLDFIKKKKVQPEVLWFNETNANEFIPKLDDRWSGSLPATMIMQQARSYKYITEGTVTVQAIRAIVDKQLTQ